MTQQEKAQAISEIQQLVDNLKESIRYSKYCINHPTKSPKIALRRIGKSIANAMNAVALAKQKQLIASQKDFDPKEVILLKPKKID